MAARPVTQARRLTVGIFRDPGCPGSVDGWDNRLVCVRFPTQKPKSDCSENRNRRFHVCAGRMMPRKVAAGQKEILLPISGKRAAKQEAKKADKPAAARSRKRA